MGSLFTINLLISEILSYCILLPYNADPRPGGPPITALLEADDLRSTRVVEHSVEKPDQPDRPWKHSFQNFIKSRVDTVYRCVEPVA